jgi:hypothetical protein
VNQVAYGTQNVTVRDSVIEHRHAAAGRRDGCDQLPVIAETC